MDKRTICLGLLDTARASEDDSSRTVGDGISSVLITLFAVSGKGHWKANGATYRELAECERHVLSIASDLDENCAELAEKTCDLSLQSLIRLHLSQAKRCN